MSLFDYNTHSKTIASSNDSKKLEKFLFFFALEVVIEAKVRNIKNDECQKYFCY